MTVGEVIGGYTVLEDFRVVGAGLSEWTFAERGGREYFLKRFLSPTYPDDAAPGSAQTKARKRARCAAFEAHHRGMIAALGPVTRYGGNLIATLDFFRHGAKYYKVTEKIPIAGFDAVQIATMAFPAKLVLLKTVAHSLRILHTLDIVHGDLKPSNILIKKTELGHTTKLIDFDNSYIVGKPPPPDEIVGTMNYYSPELVRYIRGEGAATELTAAADIFALGLIFTEYLAGAMPTIPAPYREAAVAVLNGAALTVPPVPAPGVPESVVELVGAMMSADPAKRPSIGEVHAGLMGVGKAPTTVAKLPGRPAPVPTVPPSAIPTTGRSSVLRGKGLRVATGTRLPRPVPSESSSGTAGLVGRMVGTLMDRLERGGRR
jgi:eukaryotic-like serine/threonine-protein kinase